MTPYLWPNLAVPECSSSRKQAVRRKLRQRPSQFGSSITDYQKKNLV